MDSEESIWKISLHSGGERFKVLEVGNERGYLLICTPLGTGSLRDIATETARVVTETGDIGVRFNISQPRRNGAKVDLEATQVLVVIHEIDRWSLTL